jgi:hypothetical protein
MTAVGTDSAQRDTRQNALAAQLAFRGALLDVSGSTRRLSSELSRLKARGRGLSGSLSELFVPFIDYGAEQVRWMDAQLAAATRLANAASQVEDPGVKLEQAHHEAIHGGGDWKLGRTWPGEWNRMIMKTLYEAEAEAGRMLTRNAILNIVAKAMEDYYIPIHFIPWRGP